MYDLYDKYYLNMWLIVFIAIILWWYVYMRHPIEIKYKMKYAPVTFDFKTKKVELGEEMTAEIIVSEPWKHIIFYEDNSIS